VLAAWSVRRGAIAPAIAGAVKGALAVALIGPGLDWLISGTPPMTRMPLALAAGGLVGAALGIRNHRPPKPTSV
jgi:hypothetical protein